MSIQKEVVYETEDLPAEEAPQAEEKFESEDVETMHTDVDAALKRFGGRLLDAAKVDFSDSIAPRRRKGYSSGHYILEVVGPTCDEPETLEQKFNRLRCELNELQSTVEAAESKEEKIPVRKSDLDELNDVLKAAIAKKADGKNAPGKENGTVTPQSRRIDGIPTDPASSDLINLESRIKRIESVLGGDRTNARVHAGPLLESVEDLRLRVETLNPAYLDSVKAKLTAVIGKLNEYDEKKNKQQGDVVEERINKLYELVLKWDATCSQVPALVKRLQTLAKLHEQAEAFSSQLNEMTTLRQHVEKKIEADRMTLFELKRDSAKMVDDLSAKISSLEQILRK
ncbi:DNC-2 protein [Aphelenchoides avenae]|nr:DNC-2 protein [Aphelenchus avenae]